jgi:hypothetical protein
MNERTDPGAHVTFSLWKIPGQKTLFHDGADLLLTACSNHETSRVSIDARLCEGSAFEFAVPASADLPEAWRAASHAFAPFASRHRPTRRSPHRPNRYALFHARSLQALDGEAAGASHREIARVIYGDSEVWQRWTTNSELRAQLRHLLRRGHELVDGGYRRLLVKDREGDPEERSDPP